MFDLEIYLTEKRKYIEKELDKWLPSEKTRPIVLHKAMRYSVLAGGKRLRPILCLAAAEAIDSESDAILPALALEVLHTYTLIHDDLPAMDDDDLRRGKPTNHVVFGEANAILAGDALLTLAFEWLAKIGRSELITELAQAAGSEGVIAGQVEDLAAEGKKITAKQLSYIHKHKTAALIRATVRLGGLTAKAGSKQLRALSRYGEKVGLAFQIVDDILNTTSDAKTLGKAVKSDEQREKATYVALYGVKKASRQAERLVEEAVKHLNSIKGDTLPLIALARYIVKRSY